MLHGEKFNTLTHTVGAIFAAVGAIILVAYACHTGDPWKIVSFSVYGCMLFLLYLASSLYHGSQGSAKVVLRHFDHCAIYLLIAGTYTPFALVTLRGAWGWSIFGTVWGLALLGIVQELWHISRTRLLSLVIYIMMGWMVLVAIGPLYFALGRPGFIWLAAGGALYTSGIIFYVNDEKLRHGHGIWHLFVVGGSVCQYFSVLLYVA